jgi:glycosyltransferase involved in cell wall biosynthesis
MPPLLKDSNEIVGGAAVQWKSWIRGFLDIGSEFGLLTYEGAKKYINKDLEFDIVESYNPNYGIKKVRLLYYQIPKLYQAIKKYNPDYLIQGAATAHTFILMFLAKLLHIPFIHRIASDVDVDERIYTLMNDKREVFFYRLGVKYSNIILAQNNYQQSKLKHNYPSKIIFVLHNPFELETNEKDILPRGERKYVAWIGNFRKIKNLPALAFTAQMMPDTMFKIAGIEHENLDQETKNIISELKNMDNINFVGYIKRNEMKNFLSHSIALLNTSLNEGFSNTFLEAWSLGVPVVTTKNVNPDEIVNKYNLGKVADEYDQLHNMLRSIAEYDNNEYDSLAKNCFRYVKEKHDPKYLANQFILYLNSCK